MSLESVVAEAARADERLEAEGYTGVLAEAGVSVGLPTGVTHPGGHEAGFGEDPFADPLDR